MADLTRFDFHAMRFMESEWVQRMTAAQVGQYLLLMCKAWLGGKDTTLPDDLQLLASWARVHKVDDIVLDRFPVVDTKWGKRRQNQALFLEWKATISRSTDASENGRRGAESKWGKEIATPYSPIAPKPNLAIPIHTKPNQNTGQGDFETFWKEYPRKDAKKNAEKAFRKVRSSDLPAILGAIKALKKTEQWLVSDGKFIPHAATFLNQERWKDVKLEIESQEPGVDKVALRAHVDSLIEADRIRIAQQLEKKREQEERELAGVDTWL